MFLAGLLLLVGLFYLFHGLAALRGAFKRSFMRGGRINGFYAEVPWGIAFILAGLWWANFWPALADRLFYLAAFGFFLGLSFSIFKPDYMKPAWYRWLEQAHGQALPRLRAAALELGWPEWEQRVKTQSALEAWVDQTLAADPPEEEVAHE